MVVYFKILMQLFNNFLIEQQITYTIIKTTKTFKFSPVVTSAEEKSDIQHGAEETKDNEE